MPGWFSSLPFNKESVSNLLLTYVSVEGFQPVAMSRYRGADAHINNQARCKATQMMYIYVPLWHNPGKSF